MNDKAKTSGSTDQRLMSVTEIAAQQIQKRAEAQSKLQKLMEKSEKPKDVKQINK